MAGIAAEHERHVLLGRSTAELAAALGRVLDDPDLAGRMSSAARKLVESRYDWRVITPAYLRLLTSARRTARNTR
jgi:glycosyltransferase involved in cell wall biosynthesis